MVDRITIYERCIAIQFQREANAACSRIDPFSRQQILNRSQNVNPQRISSQFQYSSLPRKPGNQNQASRTSSTLPNGVTPSSSNPAISSMIPHRVEKIDSPKSPIPKSKICVDTCNSTSKTVHYSPNKTANSHPQTTQLISQHNDRVPGSYHHFSNSYQEGYELFLMWVDTNAVCVWDIELVRAVKGTHFGGVLAGGFILVGGPPRVLATISHAHSRALLNAPIGWTIVVLGELQGSEASVVAKGQFTPLCDALCWVIHKLTTMGAKTNHENVCSSLLIHFPAIAPPEPAIIHAALSDLIRERKVFHTSRGYGIVYDENAYLLESSGATSSPRKNKHEPPKLLTTSEALTKAHGIIEVQDVGTIRHAAVQTDLADLLSGIWSNSTILTARPEITKDKALKRTESFRRCNDSVSNFLNENRRLSRREKYQIYRGNDLSDVQIKGGDKGGSVFAKILRVSQARCQLASFNAQFPPPEWTDPQAKIKHMHSVSTQTKSSKNQGEPDNCWIGAIQWPRRSCTLPRRPSRPISTSPVPNEVNLRAHSSSPSPAKLHQPRTQLIHDQKSDNQRASLSINMISNQSSRNQSPSLNSSSASHLDSSGYMTGASLPTKKPYKGMSPTHDRNHSPSRYRHNTSSPHRTVTKKPPPSASPHHVHYKEPRKKTIGHLAQENSVLEVFTTNRKNGKTHNYEASKNPRNSSSSPVRGKVKINSNQHQTRSYSEDNSKEKNTEVCEDQKSKNNETLNSKQKQDRSNLQLELISDVPMNNYKNVVSSPQKPEGIKNVLHDNFSSIAKGSLSDLTSKNMGYREINKCEKKLYCEEPKPVGDNKDVTNFSPLTQIRQMKLSLPVNEISSEKELKKVHSNKNDIEKKSISPLDDIRSVKTYPSLSELNLNFSSFTAQKILQGVSANSIDTLVEVNLIAEKRNQISDGGVTNTDFGFV